MTRSVNRIATVSALLQEYEDKAADLKLETVIKKLRDLDFHAVQTGPNSYAVVSTQLTPKGLRSLYAMVKMEADVIEHRAERGAA